MNSWNSLGFVILAILGLIYECKSTEISDNCIGCICDASTSCNKDQKCSDGGVCGPLLITWQYWSDGGSLRIKGSSPSDNAYVTCSTDLYCASETVRNYMTKYGKDCNGDGTIDCQDYSRIHKYGPYSCSNPEFDQTEYGRRFAKCNARVKP